MTFFSVLLALIIEQLRALGSTNPVATLLRSHAAGAGRGLDAGRGRHGLLAWLGVVLPWTLGVGIVYYLLYRISVVLAFAWNVTVLYFTLGFRQFSHYFTDIHVALNNDDLPLARTILKEWTGADTLEMPPSEVVRLTLIHAIVSAHRHVFGVFFWFLIPIGPAGAVLYRIAAHLSASWSDPFAGPAGRTMADPVDPVAPADFVMPDVAGADAAAAAAALNAGMFDRNAAARSSAFGGFAKRAFYYIDWIPVRLTALGFAIVGNFEDAISAWRNDTRRWPGGNDDTLLAAGGGALGVRLSGPQAELSTEQVLNVPEASADRPAEECTPRTLQSAVGLVWRAVILWMILLLMVSVSVWFG